MNDMDLQRMINEAIAKEVDKKVYEYLTGKCDHVFKPTNDGTNDLKCIKCKKRAMQAVIHKGLKSKSIIIDEYNY